MSSLKLILHVGLSKDLFLLFPYNDMREVFFFFGFFVMTVLNMCVWVGRWCVCVGG